MAIFRPQDKYIEQYGALKGRITITETTTTIDVNFASYRKYAQVNIKNRPIIKRELTIFGAAEDETVFNLGVKCYSAGSCTQ